MLHTLSYGSPAEHPPLLIVHGLFGSARNWGVISRHMADGREVIAVDQRNHGDSPWYPTQSYADMARDIAEVIEAHGGCMDVLGHSMGGKAAMVLALTRPELVNRLVVGDIAPVAYGHTQLPLVQAMQRLDLNGLSLRSEANRRLAKYIPSEQVRAFLLQSLDLKTEPAQWKLNLDVLGAEMDKILSFPAVSGSFERPALFLSGAQSDYLQPKDHPRILELFPKAQFAQIEAAGHWLHAEQPRAFEAALRAFLD